MKRGKALHLAKTAARPLRRALGLGGRPRAGVLMYHRVAQEISDPWGLCVTPENFAQQMEVIARAHAHIDLAALQGEGGYAPFGRRLAVTFDDGYLDNATNALPLLERFEIPATIFIVTGAIGRDREFWWDALDRAVLGHGELPESLSISIGGTVHEFDLVDAAPQPSGDTDWQATFDPPRTRRQSLFLDLWKAIAVVSPPEQDEAVDRLLAWAGKPVPPPAGRGTAPVEVIERLSRHPLITIGSHTMNHVSLPDIPPAEQHREVESGHRGLEEIVGGRIDRFSYPFGRFTKPARACAEAMGVALACTSQDGAVTAQTDPLALPRLQVADIDGDGFGKWLFRQYGLMEPGGLRG